MYVDAKICSYIILQLADLICLFVGRNIHSFKIRIEMIWPCFWALAVGKTFEHVSTLNMFQLLSPWVSAMHLPFTMQLMNPRHCISMVTSGIKNASKLPSAKGEWQQKEAMTAGDSVFSGCLTEMYHITPMYETPHPSHTCTSVTVTYTYHYPHLTSCAHWTMELHSA